MLLKSFEGVKYRYKSVHSVMNTHDAIHILVELPNIPPYRLTYILELRVGASNMLLHKIIPPKLYNVTRSQVKVLHRNVVEATILRRYI